jgi:hypothetical protein
MPKMDVANLHDTHPIRWMTPEPEAGFDRDQNRAFRHPHSKFREPPSAVGPSLRALPPRTAAVVLGIFPGAIASPPSESKTLTIARPNLKATPLPRPAVRPASATMPMLWEPDVAGHGSPSICSTPPPSRPGWYFPETLFLKKRPRRSAQMPTETLAHDRVRLLAWPSGRSVTY